MKKLKKIFFGILCLLGGILALLLIYGGLAYGLSHTAHTVQRDENLPRHIPIYIISNGVHTDIAMPMKNHVFDWQQMLNPHDTEMGRQQNPQYIAIGWGDRGFYLDTPTWAELKFSTAFYAVTGLSQSAIHVTYYFQNVEENENVAKLMINENEYRRLVQQVQSSFRLPENGLPQRIGQASYGNNDAFYEAHGRYHLFQTCNTWTNAQLKASGLPAVKWTPFAKPLVDYHQQNRDD